MNDNQPILTIIIPHRDIPDLLRRCLDSIPHRKDLQIIVVDDCSNPAIVDFKEIYSFTSSVIECYQTPKALGGGAARNLGLEYAKGVWITFIDADDYVTPKFNDIVNKLYTISEDIDILYCAANSVDSDYYTSSNRATTLNHYIDLHQHNNSEGERRLRYTFGEPWCKIVRRQLIFDNNIHFSETTIHNDTKYSYLVGYYAKKIDSTPLALCTITTRSNSVSKTISEQKKLERIKIFAEAHQFFRDHNIPQKYVINFLWPQMADFFLENMRTYKESYHILRKYNFSSPTIIANTIKHIVRNHILRLLRKNLESLKNRTI